MKIVLGIAVMAMALFFGSNLPIAQADDGMHFHCSSCGSHNHGSNWHDSDKDGTPDR